MLDTDGMVGWVDTTQLAELPPPPPPVLSCVEGLLPPQLANPAIANSRPTVKGKLPEDNSFAVGEELLDIF